MTIYDYGNMMPEELADLKAATVAQIEEYEGYLAYVLADLRTQSAPLPGGDPLIFDLDRWAQIAQLHADASSYVPYINSLHDQLKQIERYLR